MYFLSIDVGTTCIKYGLYNECGKLIEYNSREYQLKQIDSEFYVDIDEIKNTVFNILSLLSKKYEISSVSFSSIGESFVLLDKSDNVLFYPMLYTDKRGEEQAEEISLKIGEEKYFKLFGTVPHPMYSVAKLLWIKENCPEIYAKADRVMLIVDYLGYLLTGKCVIDYSLAARTGVFDIEKHCFSSEVLTCLGLEKIKFSVPERVGYIVGEIKDEFNCKGAQLVLGSHDQICATVGAGVLNAGEAADGLGTVECITAIFPSKCDNLLMGKKGYVCVPFVKEGLYCTYILSFSCGAAVSFLKNSVMHCKADDGFFDYMEKNIADAPTNILTLPHFNGAGTPYQDNDSKGAILGLTKETTDVEIYQSLLESTAYEMKVNMEVVEDFGVKINGAVATGGGSNSNKWLQKKADIQNIPIKQLKVSEGGLCGLAMLQSVALQACNDLEIAKSIFVKYGKEYIANKTYSKEYAKKYEKYKRLYKMVKEVL